MKTNWKILAILLAILGGVACFYREKQLQEHRKQVMALVNREVVRKSCLGNLSEIERIKLDMVRRDKRTNGTVITKADLDAHSDSFGFKARCAAGGVYTLNPIGKHAECSIPEHKLPENWKETDFLE